MKQHITEDQTMELSKESAKTLINWALKHSPQNWICRCPCKPPLLDIGQMIEFLQPYIGDLDFEIRGNTSGWSVWRTLTKNERLGASYDNDDPQLCDALWEAVKAVLESTTSVENVNLDCE